MINLQEWEEWNPFGWDTPPPIDFRPDFEDQNNNSSPTSAVHPNPWYNQAFGGYEITEKPIYSVRKLRVIATGAGASGLQAAYKIPKLLHDVELVIYEKNDDVGGTWYENKYPGCACDIPSHGYQFYWDPNPKWSAYYSPGSEIWKYLKNLADKHNLHRYIKLRHKVLHSKWDEEKGLWICQIEQPDGSIFIDQADVLLNTSGPLNQYKFPQIPGIDQFKGELMHSAAWDTSFNIDGKTVAVLGSGSSAIQVVPSIQPVARKVINFVRSPVWLTPGFSATYAGPDGTNFKYSEEQKDLFSRNSDTYFDYIRKIEEHLGSRFPMQHRTAEVQKMARDSIEARMKAKIGNADLAKWLIPTFGLGCRRISPGDEYMQSFSKENVLLVPSEAVRMTQDGVVDSQGNEYKVDVVVCATGFDTSCAPSYPVLGQNGLDLRTWYGEFPRSYLGVMVPHFPNYYQLPGPGVPASHGGILPVLEWLMRWVLKTLRKLQRENIKYLVPKQEAAVDYYRHQHTMMKRLVFSEPCSSWYKNGREVGPVCTQYPGTRLHFCELLREPRFEDFDIKYLSRNRFQYLGNGYTVEDVEKRNLTWYLDEPEM